MGKTRSVMILSLMVACCSIAYAFGTGWIRVGETKSSSQANPTADAGRPNNPPEPGARNRTLAPTDPAFQLVGSTEIKESSEQSDAPQDKPAPDKSETEAVPAKPAPDKSETEVVPAKPVSEKSGTEVVPARPASDKTATNANKDKAPHPFNELDVSLSLVGKDDKVIPLEGENANYDGPSLTLTLTIDNDAKTTPEVTPILLGPLRLAPLTVNVTKSSAERPYKFAYEIFEVGTYQFVAKVDGTTITKNVVIRSKKTLPPRVVSVEEYVAANQYDPRPLLGPVQLKSGDFKLVVTSDEAGRNLIVVDNATNKAIENVAQVPVPTAKLAVRLLLSIPKELLIDKLVDLAVYDVWSHVHSDVVTVTVPLDSNLPSGTAPARTGPNVEFPEYTPPRRVPDGFNPSDNVQTRVVRLYYYRNAHRVAQIVNRDVQSYNYVAVDTRRRQAEDARRDADNAADARARQDAKAVAKAQSSRNAEREFRRAQQKLDEVNQFETQRAQANAALVAARASVTDSQTDIKTLNEQLNTLTNVKSTADPTQTNALKQQLKTANDDLAIKSSAVSSLTKKENDLKLSIASFDLAARRNDADNARQKLETARTNETVETGSRAHDLLIAYP